MKYCGLKVVVVYWHGNSKVLYHSKMKRREGIPLLFATFLHAILDQKSRTRPNTYHPAKTTKLIWMCNCRSQLMRSFITNISYTRIRCFALHCRANDSSVIHTFFISLIVVKRGECNCIFKGVYLDADSDTQNIIFHVRCVAWRYLFVCL